MKKSILYIFLVSALFVACRKSDNPKIPELTRVPVISVAKETNADQSISAQNPAGFKARYTVDLYFKSDAPPKEVDVVVIKNGDKSNVKVLKENVTTFPSTFEVTGPELTALFGGTAIKLGDKFDIGVNITTQAGQLFEGFPATGAGTNPGVNNLPNYSAVATYEAICVYNPDVYTGNFVVVQDDWADFTPGDVVAFTKIDATHFSWVDPFARNPVPIVVTVNPLNNAATIEKQTIGTSWTYSSNPATYPNPYVFSGSGTNSVSPCEQTVTFAMEYGFGASQFSGGPYILKFRKQ